MKKILATLTLYFCLINPINANNIRDFQIEGMSIGDSLLDYFTREEIKVLINSKSTFVYPDGKLKSVKTHSNRPQNNTKLKKSKTYDYAGITFNDEKKFTIIGISAYIEFNSINECNKKRKELKKDFKNALNIKPVEEKKAHAYDKKSMSYTTWFFFSNSEYIGLNCTDWSKELQNERGWYPNFKVSLTSSDYEKTLRKNYK